MIQAIITDIEGTTSALSFVKEVLFPYARMHIADYVRHHAQEAAFLAIREAIQQEVGRILTDEELIAVLHRWMDEDRKITPLKTLQGLLWEAGYQRGDFTGHVYEDAVIALRHWHQQGIRLYVYSSGSVYAQKLLFAHTAYGDLTDLFSGFFDTHIGQKRDPSSYQAICQAIDVPPAAVLFLSDILEELAAARQTGLHTGWLIREAQNKNNDPRAPSDHRVFSDFTAIDLSVFI